MTLRCLGVGNLVVSLTVSCHFQMMFLSQLQQVTKRMCQLLKRRLQNSFLPHLSQIPCTSEPQHPAFQILPWVAT